MSHHGTGRLRHGQALESFLVETEGQMMQVIAAMVMVIRRARIIVRVIMFVIRRAMMVTGAFMVCMVANRFRTVRCEHARP